MPGISAMPILIVSIADQVVELDFAYPSEGIHKRWDAGEPPTLWLQELQPGFSSYDLYAMLHAKQPSQS